MTATSFTHPALRGRSQAPARARSRRRWVLPGQATGTFAVLAAVVTVLNMIGLVMVMSASSVVSVRETGGAWSYVERQVLWTAVGMVALVATLTISVEFWRRLATVFLGVSLVMLTVVLVPGIGVTVNGATRWLGFGPFQIQPSEFAKFALLIFVADLLARRADHVRDWRWSVLPVTAYLGIVAILVMAEPNLGTMLIIALMVLAMLFAAGVPGFPLAIVAVVGAVGATASVAFTSFRRTRFLRFLNPWADPHNSGLQNVQSMVGLANGGLWGRGLGESTVKWGYLPYAHTDFIFAVIGEEFGIMGALVVVGLFFSVAVLGAFVAARAADRYSMLVAVGITTWITVQAVMNIGAVIGIMPITGIPLPFLSFGGSSLVVNLAAVGMLLNIARHPAPAVAERRARAAR